MRCFFFWSLPIVTIVNRMPLSSPLSTAAPPCSLQRSSTPSLASEPQRSLTIVWTGELRIHCIQTWGKIFPPPLELYILWVHLFSFVVQFYNRILEWVLLQAIGRWLLLPPSSLRDRGGHIKPTQIVHTLDFTSKQKADYRQSDRHGLFCISATSWSWPMPSITLRTL